VSSSPPAVTTRRSWTPLARVAFPAARSGFGWGIGFGLYIAVSMIGYAREFPSLASRLTFAKALGHNVGLIALLGPAHEIQTTAGFVQWRCNGIVSLIGAVWALMTVSRLLRAEEESGRWDLVAAGATGRVVAVREALLGTSAGLVTLFVAVAMSTLIGSAVESVSPARSLLFACACVATPAVFVGVAAVSSQLFNSRRAAASLAAGLLGASFLLRMAADVSHHLVWLLKLTPLGWSQLVYPFTRPNPWSLFPSMIAFLALMAVAVVLGSIRDCGTGLVPSRSTRRPITASLNNPGGLAIRLALPAAGSWIAGIGLGAAFMGMIAKSAADALGKATAARGLFAALKTKGVYGFMGVEFLLIAAAFALLMASRVGSIADEESSGRLVSIMVNPPSRSVWARGRLAVDIGILAACAVVVAILAWLGAAAQGAHVELARILAASVSAAGPSILVLGLGFAVFGVVRERAAAAAYALVAWSFLLELIGPILGLNPIILNLSIFYRLAPAPAVSPDWTSLLVMAALGCAGFATGLIGLQRRDLAPG
jgi:ABC-2 type transport system permease protein